MAYVPIDGPTVFGVGVVAKAAPVQQLDQNADAINSSLNSLAPAAPTTSPHAHRGGNDGAHVIRKLSPPQGLYTGNSSTDSHPIRILTELQVAFGLDTGGVWTPSSSGWFVVAPTVAFLVPRGVNQFIIRSLIPGIGSGIQSSVALGLGLASVVDIDPNNSNNYDDKSPTYGVTGGRGVINMTITLSADKIGQMVRACILHRFRSFGGAFTYYNSVGYRHFHRWN